MFFICFSFYLSGHTQGSIQDFSEGPAPLKYIPTGAFPLLGRADFTGLTSCSSFYVIPHGLCLFCSSGKYFTTRQKFKHWCSSLWHAVIFSSTKEPLAHLPVCHWQFLPLFPASSKTDSQCSSGCTSLLYKNIFSEFFSGTLDFFSPWVSLA